MVKRYDQWHHRDAIDEMENGDYVLHSDYAALAKRCERLEAALLQISTHDRDITGAPAMIAIAARALATGAAP